MTTISHLIRKVRPLVAERPRIRAALKSIDRRASLLHHSLAARLPLLIRPQPRQLTIAITAACNLRCMGCRYGRDFMPGQTLPIGTIRELLDDARDAGVHTVRYYGGEPLLHPHLAEAVSYSNLLGMQTYVTTNGTLLKQRFPALHEAGLRMLTLGFYGQGEAHERYTGVAGQYAEVRDGLRRIRDRYGDGVELQLNWTLLRTSCNLAALHQAWEFALRFDMYFHLDLWGYSIPFFTNGPEEQLAFGPGDRPQVEQVVEELIRLRRSHPHRFPQPEVFLRSIPDWLILGPDMKVPCDAYQLLWVGADGSVQLCDTCFPLGNLRNQRLSAMLFQPRHRQACRDAFALDCPNCTCKVDSRIMKHAPSLARYRE